MKEHDGDFKMLRKKVVAMYKKWVNNQDPTFKSGKPSGDNDLHREFTKQREYLEDSLNNVTGKLTKSYQSFEQSNKRIMFQNVQLLEQFNNLKIELHLMQCQLKNGKQGSERSRLRAEIAFYQEESRRLNEQMQQIETENTEINEHVRQMSE